MKIIMYVKTEVDCYSLWSNCINIITYVWTDVDLLNQHLNCFKIVIMFKLFPNRNLCPNRWSIIYASLKEDILLDLMGGVSNPPQNAVISMRLTRYLRLNILIFVSSPYGEVGKAVTYTPCLIIVLVHLSMA